MNLILKSTGSDFILPDLGVIIASGGGSDFSGIPGLVRALGQSLDLRTRVIAGTVVVNNGAADLSALAGQQYLNQMWLQSGHDISVQMAQVEGVISDIQHGSKTTGTLHAIATPGPTGVAGFLSGTDKKKIDDIAVPNQVQVLQWFHLLPQPGASGTPNNATQNGTTYEARARFLFNFDRLNRQGTTLSGNMYARAMVSANNGDIRLYNVTDGVQLAVINFTELTMTSKLQALASIPTTGLKVVEVQFRRNGVGGTLTCEAASADFVLTG